MGGGVINLWQPFWAYDRYDQALSTISILHWHFLIRSLNASEWCTQPQDCVTCISGLAVHPTAAQCMHAVDKTVVTQDGRYEDSIESISGIVTLLRISLSLSLSLSLKLFPLSFLEPPPKVRAWRTPTHWLLEFSARNMTYGSSSWGKYYIQVTPTSYLSLAWGPPWESLCSHSETSSLCGVRVSTAQLLTYESSLPRLEAENGYSRPRSLTLLSFGKLEFKSMTYVKKTECRLEWIPLQRRVFAYCLTGGESREPSQ